MDSSSVRTAPEIAQGLAKELNGADDAVSFKKAVQDTYDVHNTSSQADWNTMSTILKNSVSLPQLGLGNFVLTGVDEATKGDPELTMVQKSGNLNVAVDGAGNFRLIPASDAPSSPTAGAAPDAPSPLAAKTAPDVPSSPTAGAAPDAPSPLAAKTAPDAPPPPAPIAGGEVTPPPGTTPDAPVVAPPVTDAPPPPPVTDAPSTTTPPPGDATSTEDPATGVGPDGSFGQNGRKMQLSSDGTQGTYTVQPGDSLWTIAEDKLGVGDAVNDPDFQTRVANLVAQLTADNNISNPDLISPGQQLTFTDLQNSASDSSSSDTSSASSSTTGTSGADTVTTQGPAVASPGADPTNQDAGTDASSQPDGSNYNTLPLPPADQDLTPPTPTSVTDSDGGDGG